VTATLTVRIPRTLTSTTDDQRLIEISAESGQTVADVLDDLASRYPIFDRRIRDETGAQRRYVNIYLDGEDIRRMSGLATPVDNVSELQIIQSVAGG
jgi:molybdopterin synthase sulfur carrier subunit